MGEKRKRHSTAYTRSSKRHSTTPARLSTPPDEQQPSDTPEVPTSFTRDGPLPVLLTPQPNDLLLKDYKSVSESKVLAESLARSHRTWIDGNIFEKFWIKPLKSRKLDPVLLEKNPSKETMTKMGACTMTCLPHKFDIKLFGVLEPAKQAPPPPQTAPAPPQGQSFQHQQGSQPTHPPTPAPLPYAPHAQPPSPMGGPIPARNSPPQTQAPTQATPAHPLTTSRPAVVPHAGPPPARNGLTQPTPPQQQPPQQHPQSHPQQPMQQAPPPQPRPDPVIQMLAMKAATDQGLKALMRIVASGKATTDQLKEFQGHIDSLTLMPPPQQMLPPMQPPPMQHPHPGAIHQPPQQFIQHPHTLPPIKQYPQQQQNQHPAQYQQHPQPRPVQTPKAKAFPSAPRQEVVSVVFEFADALSQGDRFMFPKYSILEYLNGGTTMKASFIVTRKPVDDLETSYEPVTVVLESPNPRTLEIFQRVVADPETTRTHMKELMGRLKRAPSTYLAFRLRREPGETVPERSAVEQKMDPPQRNPPRDRSRRDSSIIMTEAKNGGNSSHPPLSRPRVKNVKKHVPKPPPPPSPPSPEPVTAEPSPPPPAPRAPRVSKPPRSRKGRIADPSKNCHICNTSKTSLWRKADIEGDSVTVCNACGIKWKTNAQRQAQIAAAVASGQPIPEELKRSSSSGDQRPTEQQLASGEPQMQYHSTPLGGTSDDASPQPGRSSAPPEPATEHQVSPSPAEADTSAISEVITVNASAAPAAPEPMAQS